MQIMMNQSLEAESPYTINRKQNSVSVVSAQKSNPGKYRPNLWLFLILSTDFDKSGQSHLKDPKLLKDKRRTGFDRESMSKRQSESDHHESDHGTAYLRAGSNGTSAKGEAGKKVVAVGVGLNYNKQRSSETSLRDNETRIPQDGSKIAELPNIKMNKTNDAMTQSFSQKWSISGWKLKL